MEKNYSTYIAWLVTTLVFLTVSASLIGFPLSSLSTSTAPPTAEEIEMFSARLAYFLCRGITSRFEFNTLFIVVAVSASFTREISRGYSRILLSYPISRRLVFLVKSMLVILTPYLAYIIATLLIAPLHTRLALRTSFIVNCIRFSIVILFEMIFIYSVAILPMLLIKSPPYDVLFSLLLLLGLRYVGYIARELTYAMPPFFFNLLIDYLMFGRVFTVNEAYIRTVTAFYLLASSAGFLAAYVYFTRRFDVCRRR